MAFHFFTGENSINNTQLSEMAFGSLPDVGNFERYNLENKFSVVANAPVFAITKSLLVVVEDPNNTLLLNIALLPIESNYTAGFPIKFFIYRGVLKSSLIAGGENIKAPDNSWGSNNVLDIIKDLQDKINDDIGSDDTAKSSSLGIDFGGLSNDTILESIFFDELDDFHPLIVPKGCQIGKFAGGVNLAGVEIILDKIGDEATLGSLKSSNHVLEIQKIILTDLNEKERLKLQFKNRLAKESVLAYMDITAFYGSCENQGIRVSGVSNNTDYLNSFHNNKSVYIDIRDERGFSYNHFFKLADTIDVGFYDGNGDDLIYTLTDYYQGWPILKLDNLSYATSKEYFYIKLPILIGMPVNANIITSFTKKVSFGKSKRNVRYRLINEQAKNGDISLKESEPIRLKNWDDGNANLGANYFLLKLDRIKDMDSSQVLSPVWNSFFSLKMNPIFSLNNIEDGEFRIKTYASINAPLLTNSSSDEIFYPTIGIAADKSHITFFSFYRDSVHRNFRKNDFQSPKIIDTGKFNYAFDSNELNYQNTEQTVGFLYQITKSDKVKNYKLSQYNFTDTDNQIQDVKFLKFLKTGNANISDGFFDDFEAITLTHDEYNQLLTIQNVTVPNQDFITEHPLYIRSKGIKKFDYDKFSYLEATISLGISKIYGDNTSNSYDFDLLEYPNDITVNGEEIKLTTVIPN
ncbi:hypothetical protein [Kordia sp.]|uniref:hypothetical protein n=1 Tax=Kordia sp. TaxID=1965332 RepID=UPI003D2DCABB